RFRLGVDIGGTFTYFSLQDLGSPRLHIWKTLSAPTEPAAAAVRGALELFQNIGITLRGFGEVVLGTPIGANIVVERKGALTALITTAGFRDILVIQRQFRHSPLDLQLVKHEPLVERDLVFGVPERTLFDGTINLALDEDEVRAVARQLIERG